MFIGCCVMKFRAEWVTSLKEKRMVVKPIIEKTRHKFNVSIAEIEEMDVHQTIVIGFTCISNEGKHTEQVLHTVSDFIENSTDALLTDIEFEIF